MPRVLSLAVAAVAAALLSVPPALAQDRSGHRPYLRVGIGGGWSAVGAVGYGADPLLANVAFSASMGGFVRDDLAVTTDVFFDHVIVPVRNGESARATPQVGPGVGVAWHPRDLPLYVAGMGGLCVFQGAGLRLAGEVGYELRTSGRVHTAIGLRFTDTTLFGHGWGSIPSLGLVLSLIAR